MTADGPCRRSDRYGGLLAAESLQAIFVMKDFRDGRFELAHLGKQILAQRKEQAKRQVFMREQSRHRFEKTGARFFRKQREELFKLIEKKDDRLLRPSPFGPAYQLGKRRG